MASVRVIHDRRGETLTIWFGNPEDEYVCDLTEDEVILMKDRKGNIIGLEKLHYGLSQTEEIHIEALTV